MKRIVEAASRATHQPPRLAHARSGYDATYERRRRLSEVRSGTDHDPELDEWPAFGPPTPPGGSGS